MREPENYRHILESLLSRTSKSLLNASDVSRLTGKTRGWCRANLMEDRFITVEALAMRLSKYE